MPYFRKDSALITSKIDESCTKNLKNNLDGDYICYCCGKKIDFDENLKNNFKGLACDHLIPIMSMLLIVDNESINNNLFFIHKGCNGKKSDMDIFTFYNKAGTEYFNNNANNATEEKCKDRIKLYLNRIKFRLNTI